MQHRLGHCLIDPKDTESWHSLLQSGFPTPGSRSHRDSYAADQESQLSHLHIVVMVRNALQKGLLVGNET